MSPKPTESGVVLCCCRKENVMVWRWMDEGVNCWMCGRPVCRQTDRQTGGGWSQGGGQTAPGDGGEVTGDRTCSHPSFYLFIYFLNPLRRSLASPVGPQTCSTRKTNLWSSRLRRLVQKRWMPFLKKERETLEDLVTGGLNTRTLQNEALRRFDRSFVDDDVRICRPDRPSLSFLWRWFWQINYFTNNNIQNYEGFQWRTRSSATKRGLNNIIQSSKSLIHLVFSLFIDCLVD